MAERLARGLSGRMRTFLRRSSTCAAHVVEGTRRSGGARASCLHPRTAPASTRPSSGRPAGDARDRRRRLAAAPGGPAAAALGPPHRHARRRTRRRNPPPDEGGRGARRRGPSGGACGVAAASARSSQAGRVGRDAPAPRSPRRRRRGRRFLSSRVRSRPARAHRQPRRGGPPARGPGTRRTSRARPGR